MLILRGEISRQREQRKENLINLNLVAERQRTLQLEKDLNSILTKWKYGNKPFKNSADFLKTMGSWINDRINDQEELDQFLNRKKVKSLKDLE